MRNKEINGNKKSKTIISEKELIRLAKLANINITPNEQKKYSKDLNKVINYNMEQLKNINTVKVEPTAHATGEKAKTRVDSTEPSLNIEESLKNAPSTHNNLFKVKHVFGEE